MSGSEFVNSSVPNFPLITSNLSFTEPDDIDDLTTTTPEHKNDGSLISHLFILALQGARFTNKTTIGVPLMEGFSRKYIDAGKLCDFFKIKALKSFTKSLGNYAEEPNNSVKFSTCNLRGVSRHSCFSSFLDAIKSAMKAKSCTRVDQKVLGLTQKE